MYICYYLINFVCGLIWKNVSGVELWWWWLRVNLNVNNEILVVNNVNKYGKKNVFFLFLYVV